MLELGLRLVVALALVLGLFWLVARASARKMGGSRSLLRVHARQSLSRTSSVAVVEVGTRVLVVGVSDGGVRLLTELDPDEVAVGVGAPAPADDPSSVGDGTARPAAGAAVPGLGGSLLSAQTWKQAWAAATARVAPAATAAQGNEHE